MSEYIMPERKQNSNKSTFGKILNIAGSDNYVGAAYLSTYSAYKVGAGYVALASDTNVIKSVSQMLPEAVYMEPGRSIVADSGVTLYETGGVKEVKGYRNYVTVDGGMTDNPRYALYKADYTVLNACRADQPADYECTIAGRCCESGDRIAENIFIAKPERGDIIAVLTTGAYNYSMSSNYNRVTRPAMIMISKGVPRLVVRRESFEDLINNEL